MKSIPTAISEEITLSDGVITLKPYDEEDLPILWAAAQESVAWTGRWLPWCRADLMLEKERRWLNLQKTAWSERREFGFAIWTANLETYLGCIGLNYLDWEQRSANVGYWIRASRIGQGIAPAVSPRPPSD